MPKDTKSLGNNKAPACESRGFVHKKRGVHFDTPPLKLHLAIKPYFNLKTLRPAAMAALLAGVDLRVQ